MDRAHGVEPAGRFAAGRQSGAKNSIRVPGTAEPATSEPCAGPRPLRPASACHRRQQEAKADSNNGGNAQMQHDRGPAGMIEPREQLTLEPIVEPAMRQSSFTIIRADERHRSLFRGDRPSCLRKGLSQRSGGLPGGLRRFSSVPQEFSNNTSGPRRRRTSSGQGGPEIAAGMYQRFVAHRLAGQPEGPPARAAGSNAGPISVSMRPPRRSRRARSLGPDCCT